MKIAGLPRAFGVGIQDSHAGELLRNAAALKIAMPITIQPGSGMDNSANGSAHRLCLRFDKVLHLLKLTIEIRP
jgi:hypothetical protein